MKFFSKVCSLNIHAVAADGSVQDFQVKYRVNAFGKAKILNGHELPQEITGKYKESLLAGFLSKTDYKINEDPLGWRLQGKDGKIYQYEFVVNLPDGTSGIPYKNHVLSETEFLDMRNLRLSKGLDGATVNIFINDKVVEVKGTFEPITRVYKSVRFHPISGSSCAFTNDAPLKPREYLEIGLLNYDSQNKLLFRHFLQFNSVLPTSKAPRSKVEEWFAPRAAFAIEPSPSHAEAKNQQPEPAMPGVTFPFPAHMMPLPDALQPAFGCNNLFLGNKAESDAMQPIPLFCPAAGSPTKNPVQNTAIAQDGKQQAISRENEEEKGNSSQETGPAGGFGRQNGSTSDSAQEGKGGKSKPIPLSSLQNFKAVIFDLDGVVVDSESAHLRSFNRLLAPFGARITEKMWRENYAGMGSLAILKDVFARNGIKEDVHALMSKRAEIYHDVVVRDGLKEIQGFSQFFALLEKNGIKAAVASGGHNPHILASMMAINMPRVEFVGLEDVKHAKPAPDTFLLAAAKLGVKPSECIVIEDSLAGIKAAAAAKMPCIALTTTLPAEKIKGAATLIVNSHSSAKLKAAISRLIENNGKGKASPSGKDNGGAAGKEKGANAVAWQYPVKRAATSKAKGKDSRESKRKAQRKKRSAVTWQYPVKRAAKGRASKGKKPAAARKGKRGSRKKSR